MRAMTKKSDRRGFLAVEAAIFLPIFIIGILTLGHLMRAISARETVMHTLVIQTRQLSFEAYAQKSKGEQFDPVYTVANKGMFLFRLRNNLKAETGNFLEKVNLKEFNYLYEEDGKNNLLGITVDYKVQVPLPKAVVKKLVLEETVVARGFLGKQESQNPIPFSSMEKTKKSKKVWVFLKAGERYHTQNCGILKRVPQKMLFDRKIKENYRPCKQCCTDETDLGCAVYCFLDSGEVYHLRSCATVTHFVKEMEKEQAIRQGYTPCLLCRGGI